MWGCWGLLNGSAHQSFYISKLNRNSKKSMAPPNFEVIERKGYQDKIFGNFFASCSKRRNFFDKSKPETLTKERRDYQPFFLASWKGNHLLEGASMLLVRTKKNYTSVPAAKDVCFPTNNKHSIEQKKQYYSLNSKRWDLLWEPRVYIL